MSNVYRLRKGGTNRAPNGKVYSHYCITVPDHIAAKLVGRHFEFSIDEDGFHYRPLSSKENPQLPSWAES